MAEASYRSTIEASRKCAGRAAFDAARSAWATRHALEPDDGIYLGEVRGATVGLRELVGALEICGKTRADVIKAMERLTDGGFVSTVLRG